MVHSIIFLLKIFVIIVLSTIMHDFYYIANLEFFILFYSVIEFINKWICLFNNRLNTVIMKLN